jgi:hypothetical protein
MDMIEEGEEIKVTDIWRINTEYKVYNEGIETLQTNTE